ncbi:MAG: hypothetical protein QOH69_2557 [Actinomycetota bacterium]|nr:hypothetical protein [Actinomycetota bacterium]
MSDANDPDASRRGSRWLVAFRRTLAAQPAGIVALLALAIWITCTTPVHAPTTTLDGSWSNGLNWAILTGKQFGRDIDFTYGPWANLDTTSILSLRLFLPAVVATVITGVAFVVLGWRLLRRWLGPYASAIVVALVAAPAVATATGFSGMVLVLAVMCALGLQVGALPARWHRAMVVALGVASGLALLVKISDGILAIATVVLIASLGADASIARRTVSVVMGVVAAAVAVVVFWLAAGQSLLNFAAWFGASLQLTGGYSEAMSNDSTALVPQYLAFAALLVLLILQTSRSPRGSRAVLFITIAWVAVVALRLGFTRHDEGHPSQSFMLLLVACLALGVTRHLILSIASILLSGVSVITAFGSNYFGLLDPGTLFAHSSSSISALLSSDYRDAQLASARAKATAHYAVPKSVLAAVGSDTVHIDPQDANVAWAYGLNWDPAPVVQEYSAYTVALDQINARKLTSAAGPSAVLRAPLTAIDYRNPMWESPQYMKALICDFAPTVTSKNWLALHRVSDRCSGKTISLGVRKFAAGQAIEVPPAPSQDYVVVANFSLSESAFDLAATAVFKPPSPVLVTTNQGTYRLPRAHASGPLILTLPAAVGWGSQFGGDTKITSLGVTVSGSVTFSAIPISTRK